MTPRHRSGTRESSFASFTVLVNFHEFSYAIVNYAGQVARQPFSGLRTGGMTDTSVQ